MILAGNKKAYFDYFVEDKLEAGIELQGSEVKSAKAGKVSIKESFIRIPTKLVKKGTVCKFAKGGT